MNIFKYGFIAVLISAGSVSAQCGTRHVPVLHNVVHQNFVHETPVVVKEVFAPIAVPVLIPAFQFQYTPPCAVPVQAGYAGQPAFVPGTQPVAQNYAQPMANYGQPTSGYGPVNVGQSPSGYGPPPTAQANFSNDKDKIRELAKALIEELQKQQQGDDGPPAAPGNDNFSPPVAPTNFQPRTSPPGLPSAPTITPEQAGPLAIAALQRNCSSCHTGPGSKGDFVIFAQPGLFAQGTAWRSITKEINSGRMPPKDSQFRLTQQEADAVRAWLSGL